MIENQFMNKVYVVRIKFNLYALFSARNVNNISNTIAISNSESLCTVALAVTSEMVTTVRVASVKSPGYRDVFDFLLDMTSARFVVTLRIEDEVTTDWFLSDSAYTNHENNISK